MSKRLFVIIFLFSLVGCDSKSKLPPLVGDDAIACLTRTGSNSYTDNEYDDKCIGRRVEAPGFTLNSDRKEFDLSLSDPERSRSDSSDDYSVILKDEKYIPRYTKIYIEGIITDRTFFKEFAVVKDATFFGIALTPEEVAAKERRENRWKPNSRIDVIIEENNRLMAFAERNHDELSKKARHVEIIPNFTSWAALWAYHMPDGSIIKCTRGFQGNIFLYSCS